MINDWGDRIALQAKRWAGIEYRPGVKEQCMSWVREVLQQVQHPYAARVGPNPVDGHWTGISLASSLADRSLGELVTKIRLLEPGDIAFWDDTYWTGFPRGTITHVGICLSNESFVHRSTMSAPVREQAFTGVWRDKFRCALRVPQRISPDPAVKAPAEAATAKWYLHTKGNALQLRQELDPGHYTLYSSGSTADGSWLAKLVSKGEKPNQGGENRLWLGNGSTLDLRETLKPGSYSLVSAGSEAGAWILKLVAR